MTTVRRVCVLALVSVVLGAGVWSAVAQEAAPGAATVATSDAADPNLMPETRMTLWQLWTVGGWCMWPLGLVNVAAIAFAVYGYIFVREDKMLVPALVPGLQEALVNLRLDDAMKMCTSTPSMLTNTLHAGLQRITDGVLDVSSLEKAMEESSVEETQAGLRMINYISVSAQIAPMLGLLGTVSGMIKAFQKIGRGAMGKPEVLAMDIGEALVTTAYGLIVGIPAMIFYFHLKSRYTANITKMGRILGNMAHHLVAASRRADAGIPHPGSAPAGADEAAKAQ
ncbi:MAG: MotA/TolQ/ExbB proton channel family protein [Lentisphaerae bacterium]|nr:MotA/TolQ/ExbB proton channel family protein [Lentisphaerota bacterium]